MSEAVNRILVAIGTSLRETGFRFTTVTPSTHARNWSRMSQAVDGDLRDIFGWNRWFHPDGIPAQMYSMLDSAHLLEVKGGLARTRVRAACLGDGVFLHSAYPTVEPAAVFFGPDTYRFANLIESEAPDHVAFAVEIGCGSGAAAITLAPRCSRIIACDINPLALSYTNINAAINGCHHLETRHADVLAGIPDGIELIVANPPYMVDPLKRVYRDGGGKHGTTLATRIVNESLPKLAKGGRLILYTGSPIVAGQDILAEELARVMPRGYGTFHYRELDPDIFSEELEQPGYELCERIALIGLTICRS